MATNITKEIKPKYYMSLMEVYILPMKYSHQNTELNLI